MAILLRASVSGVCHKWAYKTRHVLDYGISILMSRKMAYVYSFRNFQLTISHSLWVMLSTEQTRSNSSPAPIMDCRIHNEQGLGEVNTTPPDDSSTIGSFYKLGFPDIRVRGDNMGPIRGRQDPGGSHVGPIQSQHGYVIRWAASKYKLYLGVCVDANVHVCA